jgi:DNA replication protein DnaC
VQRILLVTSNRAFAEWPQLLGKPLLASAALDRLAHDAHQVVITGESYRARATRNRTAEKKSGLTDSRAEG